MYTQKKEILKQIHECCQQLDIRYFALDSLAHCAQTQTPMTDTEIAAPWKIGMLRAEFNILKNANEALTHSNAVQIVVYDDLDNEMIAPENGTAFNKNLLYPIKNRRFDDILVWAAADCTMWTATDDADTKQDMLVLLRHFDAVCREAHLDYFAVSDLANGCRMYGDLIPGTAAKTTRIGMLRKDYHRLCALAPDSGLTAVRELGLTFSLGSATLQIMPYDYLPQDEKARKDFLKQARKLHSAYRKAAANDTAHPDSAPTAPELYQYLHAHITRCNTQAEELQRIACMECGLFTVWMQHHIFPTVRRRMGDFTLCCPANPYLWAPSSDISYHEAASIHKTEILKRLNCVLEAHGLTAFPIGDLLVGTVTYRDYVPGKPGADWDIALLRKDYEALLSTLRANAGAYGLALQEYRDEAGLCPKATKTVSLLEKNWLEGFVRLVPFDKMPEAYDTQYAFLRKLNNLNNLYKQLAEQEITGTSKLSEKQYRNILRKYGSQPMKALYQHIDTLAQTYNDDADTHQFGRMALEKSKFVKESDLFPLEKVPFRDIQLNRPRDYSVWTPVIDEALKTQVRSIQKADYLLIDKVDEICRKLDIGYFICGGSMLGFMRNGGFIPWDDDIDVAMLRKDYDRFIREAQPYLDDRFFLQTRQTDPDIPYLFSKLRLNNTEYITEYNERRPFHKGICLDIFPFDFIPNDPKEQEKFKNEVLKLSRAHNRIVNNQMPEPIDPVEPRNLKEHYYRAYGKLKRFYFFSQSLKKSQQAYLEKATSLNDKAEELGLTTVASFVPSYTYIKLEDLLPYQDVYFDGHLVKIPHRPDVFLTMQYGDYLQLPPKHNQVAHRLVRWSIDVKADEEQRQSEK